MFARERCAKAHLANSFKELSGGTVEQATVQRAGSLPLDGFCVRGSGSFRFGALGAFHLDCVGSLAVHVLQPTGLFHGLALHPFCGLVPPLLHAGEFLLAFPKCGT